MVNVINPNQTKCISPGGEPHHQTQLSVMPRSLVSASHVLLYSFNSMFYLSSCSVQ